MVAQTSSVYFGEWSGVQGSDPWLVPFASAEVMLRESSDTSLVSQSIPPALKSLPKMRVVLWLFLKVSVISDS